VIGKLLPLRRLRVPTTSDLSDEALLAACATGDRAALGVLFDRHRDHVHRFLARLRLRDPRDQEDLLQATFLEAQRSARRFGGRASVRTWLMAVAANVARHHMRAESRRRAAMQRLGVVPRPGPDSPADEAQRRQISYRLAAALAGLNDHLRVPFVMCDLEGVATEQAARVLNLRMGTLWRRLHEARTALRRAIEEEEGS
jgi:RNA polymerase sigma-70 factor (ECF subfamily)